MCVYVCGEPLLLLLALDTISCHFMSTSFPRKFISRFIQMTVSEQHYGIQSQNAFKWFKFYSSTIRRFSNYYTACQCELLPCIHVCIRRRLYFLKTLVVVSSRRVVLSAEPEPLVFYFFPPLSLLLFVLCCFLSLSLVLFVFFFNAYS